MAEKKFNLQIISPTRVFFDGDIDMVEMKTTEGEIGVLAGHIPLTAILEPGVLRIKKSDGDKEAALHQDLESADRGYSAWRYRLHWQESYCLPCRQVLAIQQNLRIFL